MEKIELIEALGELAAGDFADIVTRYVHEAYPTQKATAAKLLAEAAYRGIPQDVNSDDKPRLLPVAAFMSEIGEPPGSLADGFLPANKLIALSGVAKQGKSLVALEVLQCVSSGRQLMGRFPINERGSVAYFGLEDGGHEIKKRLTDKGITDAANFYVCWISFDMASVEGFANFQALIAEMETPPSLVIIDTAREAFRSIRDWNDPTQVGDAVSPFRRWAHTNCTVILITHNNKNAFASGVNKISGSGALVSSVDCYMILENRKVLENGNLQWNWEMGGRGLKQTELMLEMDTNTLQVRVLDKDEVREAQAEATGAAKTRAKAAIVAHVFTNGEATVKHIAAGIDMSYALVRRAVIEMAEAGHLSRTGRKAKVEGSGRPADTFQLTVAGRELFIDGECPTQ